MTINLLLLPHPQRQSLLQQLERNEREMAATAMELDLYLQGRRRNRMRSPFALPPSLFNQCQGPFRSGGLDKKVP